MIVAIAIEQETPETYSVLWALDDEGRLFRMVQDPMMAEWEWRRVQTPDPNVDADTIPVPTVPRQRGETP